MRSFLDPLALYVGQMIRAISDNPGESTFADSQPYIDREQKIVRSATGELAWGRTTGSAGSHGATDAS